MKKSTILIATLFSVALPLTSFAAMDHSDHGSMDMGHGGHGMMEMGDVAHQEVVDGVKATFKVINMKEHMKGMEMPKGMKETHHLAAEFQDAKSGKALTVGEVKAKVQGTDKVEQTKELMGMQGHFGADFDLSKKGKYSVICKFLLKDGKVRNAKFWYTAK